MLPDIYEVLQAIGADDWDADPDGAVLYCPHGNAVEPDGVSFDGCVSPLRSAGLI